MTWNLRKFQSNLFRSPGNSHKNTYNRRLSENSRMRAIGAIGAHLPSYYPARSVHRYSPSPVQWIQEFFHLSPAGKIDRHLPVHPTGMCLPQFRFQLFHAASRQATKPSFPWRSWLLVDDGRSVLVVPVKLQQSISRGHRIVDRWFMQRCPNLEIN